MDRKQIMLIDLHTCKEVSNVNKLQLPDFVMFYNSFSCAHAVFVSAKDDDFEVLYRRYISMPDSDMAAYMKVCKDFDSFKPVNDCKANPLTKSLLKEALKMIGAPDEACQKLNN